MNFFWYFFPLVLQTTIWIPTRLVFLIFLNVDIRGIHNLSFARKGVIFAVNHTSELDPIVIPASLPFLSHFMPMFYVSREQAFYKKSGWRQAIYGGTFFKLWGAHGVQVGIKNYEESLKTHINILKGGGSICIFPEGKRSVTGDMGEAKGGVAYLSTRARAQVIPVYVSGLFEMSAKDFLTRKRKLIVSFGAPIEPESIPLEKEAEDPYKKGAQYIREKIVELLPR